MAKITKKQVAINGKRVSRLYAESCSGIQISVHSMGQIMKVGMDALNAGESDESIKAKLRACVDALQEDLANEKAGIRRIAHRF